MIDVGRPEVFHIVIWVAGALLASLVVFCRRLARRAEIDHAERVLREEYDREDEGG